MTTIIVSGVIANKYLNGGNAWVVLTWVRGLQRLGCQVHFVEQLLPQDCIDPYGRPAGFQDSINLAFFNHVTETFGLRKTATCIFFNGPHTFGLTIAELSDLFESADLLVNISGHLTLESLLRRIKRKAYLDLDPGYTQIWHANGDDARLPGHDLYFTLGENVGTANCRIPTNGIDWIPMRPPVLLDEWPFVGAIKADRFTTIASWRGAFGRVQWGDKLFGQKAHEFRKFIELPRRVPHEFEIALDIHPAEIQDWGRLLDFGWHLVNPRMVASDPIRFREYVQASGAEFSVAQGIYVETQSGWFSDRTVRYLASGKPALVQDTGFQSDYASAGGLVPFRTLDEAAAGAAQITQEYSAHCRAARAVAEQYFDSDKVLARFLEQAGLGG